MKSRSSDCCHCNCSWYCQVHPFVVSHRDTKNKYILDLAERIPVDYMPPGLKTPLAETRIFCQTQRILKPAEDIYLVSAPGNIAALWMADTVAGRDYVSTFVKQALQDRLIGAIVLRFNPGFLYDYRVTQISGLRPDAKTEFGRWFGIDTVTVTGDSLLLQYPEYPFVVCSQKPFFPSFK